MAAARHPRAAARGRSGVAHLLLKCQWALGPTWQGRQPGPWATGTGLARQQAGPSASARRWPVSVPLPAPVTGTRRGPTAALKLRSSIMPVL
jgi:hypothetical protein